MSVQTDGETAVSGSELGSSADGIVPNEPLVITPVPELQAEKIVEKIIPEGPTGEPLKDTGPPDGGYGWIVVMYSPTMFWLM